MQVAVVGLILFLIYVFVCMTCNVSKQCEGLENKPRRRRRRRPPLITQANPKHANPEAFRARQPREVKEGGVIEPMDSMKPSLSIFKKLMPKVEGMGNHGTCSNDSSITKIDDAGSNCFGWCEDKASTKVYRNAKQGSETNCYGWCANSEATKVYKKKDASGVVGSNCFGYCKNDPTIYHIDEQGSNCFGVCFDNATLYKKDAAGSNCHGWCDDRKTYKIDATGTNCDDEEVESEPESEDENNNSGVYWNSRLQRYVYSKDPDDWDRDYWDYNPDDDDWKYNSSKNAKSDYKSYSDYYNPIEQEYGDDYGYGTAASAETPAQPKARWNPVNWFRNVFNRSANSTPAATAASGGGYTASGGGYTASGAGYTTAASGAGASNDMAPYYSAASSYPSASPTTCASSMYGCCPDGKTARTSRTGEGCPLNKSDPYNMYAGVVPQSTSTVFVSEPKGLSSDASVYSPASGTSASSYPTASAAPAASAATASSTPTTAAAPAAASAEAAPSKKDIAPVQLIGSDLAAQSDTANLPPGCPAPRPCPACDRCPEPAFECKKVPNYERTDNEKFVPQAVLTDFSSFGM